MSARNIDDTYGKGPIAQALDDIKAFNALPASERVQASRHFLESRINSQHDDEDSEACSEGRGREG